MANYTINRATLRNIKNSSRMAGAKKQVRMTLEYIRGKLLPPKKPIRVKVPKVAKTTKSRKKIT